MENNTCGNCVFFSKNLFVCFNDANEGMRVFNPNQIACAHFKPLDKNNKEKK